MGRALTSTDPSATPASPRPGRAGGRRAGLTAVAGAATVAALASSCIYPSPSPATTAQLSRVATVSSHDAWAVGSYLDATGRHDLIEHWDGKAWKVFPVPKAWGHGLIDITAVNAKNVWATGSGRTLHWNGRSWSAALDPSGISVKAIASSPDGGLAAIAHQRSTRKDVLLRRTAGGWQPLAAPAVPTSHRACDGTVSLSDLTMYRKTDIWAVGHVFGPGSSAPSCGYTAHWNGSRWTTVALPDDPALPQQWWLSAVSARGPKDVWVVGGGYSEFEDTGRFFDFGVALHWNGSSWNHLFVSADVTALNDVDATGRYVWAVGGANEFVPINRHMAIERWSGTTFEPQPRQDLRSSGGYVQMELSGVSVRDGVVISLGKYERAPDHNATLIDQRADG